MRPGGAWFGSLRRKRADLSFKQDHELFDRPGMTLQPGFHCGRDAQRFVNPDKVVVHEVNRHRVAVVGEFFSEGVRQSREPVHAHAHR